MPRNSADDELKKSIEYMSDKIDELSKTKQEISQIFAMVTKLQKIVESKDKQI